MDINDNTGVLKLIEEANKNRIQNEFLKALEKYNEALYFLEGEDKIDIYFEIADIYSEISDFKKANNIYKNILDMDPENSGAWYGVAFTNELMGGDILKSLKAYENAFFYRPDYKEAYYYAATIYGDMKDFKKAILYLEKAIELDPDDFVSLSDLGSIYEQTGELEKAKSYLDKSIKINGNYYLSRFNLGVVYKAMGKKEKALDEYKIAKELSDYIYIYLNMSAIYIEEKEFQNAIDILSEGIRKKPHHILYYNRACSYRKLGNIDKAMEDFNSAKEIDNIVLKWAKNDPDLMDLIGEEK